MILRAAWLVLGVALAQDTRYQWVPFGDLGCVASDPSGRRENDCRSPASRADALACQGLCQPFDKGHWCRGLDGCAFPLYALERDGDLVPPLHATQDGGPYARCLRALGPNLGVAFVGDSQTRMVEFEFVRWLGGGATEPHWAMVADPSTLASIFRAGNWSFHLDNFQVRVRRGLEKRQVSDLASPPTPRRARVEG